jgi:hypothetical protein
MKKISIGNKIYDVIDEKEYIRRSYYDKEMAAELASDTAVDPGDGYVYPVVGRYSENNMGVTDYGPILRYSNPKDFPNKEEYKTENIIDFDKPQSGGFKERIQQIAKLEEAERNVLISKDNIYHVAVRDTDTAEMQIFKTALNKKNIDILAYKPRFLSDYSNDVRVIQGDSITFGKLKKLATIFDMDITMTIKDKPGAVNPIGEELTAKIND